LKLYLFFVFFQDEVGKKCGLALHISQTSEDFERSAALFSEYLVYGSDVFLDEALMIADNRCCIELKLVKLIDKTTVSSSKDLLC